MKRMEPKYSHGREFAFPILISPLKAITQLKLIRRVISHSHYTAHIRDTSDQTKNGTGCGPSGVYCTCQGVERHTQSFDLQRSLKVTGLNIEPFNHG